LPISTSAVYANLSFARGAKNKLADDGGGLTTTMFFHSLFSPTASPPFTGRSL